MWRRQLVIGVLGNLYRPLSIASISLGLCTYIDRPLSARPWPHSSRYMRCYYLVEPLEWVGGTCSFDLVWPRNANFSILWPWLVKNIETPTTIAVADLRCVLRDLLP